MRISELFEQWMSTACTDSEYAPWEQDLNKLYFFSFELLHLATAKILALQDALDLNAKDDTARQENLSQMKVCLHLVEVFTNELIKRNSFWFYLFCPRNSVSIFDRMSMLHLKQIEGTRQNSEESLRIGNDKWIPRHTNNIQQVVSHFVDDEKELSFQEFCNNAFIQDLKNAVFSEDPIIRIFPYDTSPVRRYQESYTALKDSPIPATHIQQQIQPTICVRNAIVEKCKKDSINNSAQFTESTDTDLAKSLLKGFSASPLSRHSNLLLYKFNFHGNTQTVQTIFASSKKSLIKSALGYPLTANGFIAMGTALKGLVREGSDERKIIRRPLEKKDYTSWFCEDADTKSYQLIHTAIVALYGDETNHIIKLNATAPFLNSEQAKALNNLADYADMLYEFDSYPIQGMQITL